MLTFFNRTGFTPPPPPLTQTLLSSACSPGEYSLPTVLAQSCPHALQLQVRGKGDNSGLFSVHDVKGRLPHACISCGSCRFTSCTLANPELSSCSEYLRCSKRVILLHVMHADVMWELPPHVIYTDLSEIVPFLSDQQKIDMIELT